MQQMRIIIVIMFLSLLSRADTISGIVSRCHDGDTCTVISDGKKISVRFSGIDAPEIKQTDGKAARDFAEGLIKGKVVRLQCEGKSYNRTTCTVFLGGTDINAEIVKAGFAYDIPKYSKGRYKMLMHSARDQKIGIWKNDPISPYCFRKKNNEKCKIDPTLVGD